MRSNENLARRKFTLAARYDRKERKSSNANQNNRTCELEKGREVQPAKVARPETGTPKLTKQKLSGDRNSRKRGSRTKNEAKN
jgi:hypothetical protein